MMEFLTSFHIKISLLPFGLSLNINCASFVCISQYILAYKLQEVLPSNFPDRRAT